MTSLRTVEGIAKERVEPPFLDHLSRAIARFVSAGLIQETPTHFRPTPAGLLQADGMAADLMALPSR